ncbi:MULTISPECIES: hypothetical protein [unclassified Ensifer]|uniref:hypothetical protein n=1 Tax=unclassified Ensifer TaxID=2633371 RepID=UPI00081357ED|nr:MULTISPECIES: hypothetical protein [unclassified Ensifer]OCP08027.1 hypothetical protein BC362_10490 [Ensifer sp. LC14]OCP10863.1 hypothetical protein BC374_17475 [Ensifer sp. LC13]OCP11592.1 hypothetical protein BBX50_18380 [Ensifer sp. LC11]OCP33410.1 hypothetical protein BC364_17270 [Ensifer sp. LC499]
MADFVAVIRRTVDGLSENTPEMRDRVYEKARAAVRRQLENMNPRPSDDMINRQLAKLENAIAEVDSEHAEALPAIDEPAAQEDVVETVAAEAAAAEEVAAEPEGQPEAIDEPAGTSEPVAEAEQPVAETEGAAEIVAETHAEPAQYAQEPADAVAEAPAEQVVSEPAAEHELQAEPEPVDELQPEAAYAEAVEAPVEETSAPVVEEQQPEPYAEEAVEYPDHVEPMPVEAHEADVVSPPVEAESRPTEEPSRDEAPAEPVEHKPAASEWDLPEWDTVAPASAPVATSAQPSDEQDTPHQPELLGMHPVDEPQEHVQDAAPKADPARSWSFDDNDPFAPLEKRPAEKAPEPEIGDWSWPVEKPAQAAAANAPQSQQERAGTAWDHIDDLLGFEDAANAAATGAAASATSREPERASEGAATAPRPASYRATPKPSRFSIKRLVIAAIALVALGGGGFAYWQNREAGNAWISSVVASITSVVSNIGGAPAEQNTPPQPAGETAKQEPAAHDDTVAPESSSTKFTQRLLADGSETDDGPATVTGESAAQEGKSVAPQTEAGKPVETATVQGGAAGQAGAPATGQPAGQATQPEVAIANGEKMFLYEERLGQSSPTAVPGTVAWSVKEESPGGDAKPEPAIQAQITIPDRGLTALMTIKRNADASLPASHVIEFVFSLPQNFEGGAIDSVQRVSMKRTEQDRGDALIAVPAKITDDFHMIALNDATDAISNNAELLRSRSWIDIPLTYRNGRRALLTLEKGQSGTDAFNQAMRAWGASGTAAATNSQ